MNTTCIPVSVTTADVPTCCACGCTDEYHLGFCFVCEESVCDLPTCTGKCKCAERLDSVRQQLTEFMDGKVYRDARGRFTQFVIK